MTVLGMVLSKGESGEGGLNVASAAESFGFKSFGVAESVVGGELANGARAIVGFSRSGEELGVNISWIQGPAGTVSKLEEGAVNAAKAQGLSEVQLKATNPSNAMARLLRQKGFTQEVQNGHATGSWIKRIK